MKKLTNIPHLISTRTYLICIVFLAFFIRFLGINSGLPLINHPDEPAVVRAALEIRFYKNPGHFDWPHLYIYLNYFVYMVFGKIRDIISAIALTQGLKQVIPIIWDDKIIFYIISRIVTIFFGALTVIPFYLIGKELISKKWGLISALFIAFLPFHVIRSYRALIDVPMMFFLCFGIYFCIRLQKEKNLKNFVLSGMFFGLSASVKYNGAYAIISILLALLTFDTGIKHIFKKLFTVNNIKGAVLSAVAFIVAFVAGTPFSVFDFKTFIRTDGPKGALWQFYNVGKQLPQLHQKQFIEALTDKLQTDMGYIPITLFLILTTYFSSRFVFKKYVPYTKNILFMLIPSWIFIYQVSGYVHDRSHYYMIAYPYIIFGGILMLKIILNNIHKVQIKVFIITALILGLLLQSILAIKKETASDPYKRDFRQVETKEL